MQRERVTDDIYVFTSDLYAQVTASVIMTRGGAVLLDTLAYPEETRQIKHFVENRLHQEVRYIINSHYHADHTTGTYLFPNAQVIAHQRCRDLLHTQGRESLERARNATPELREAELILPDCTFADHLTLYLDDKTLELWSAPGHSPDSIVCYVPEDEVLLAADTFMSIPYFVNGSYDDLLNTIQALQTRQHTYECIVQGHGEVVLKGEIEDKIQSDIDYLVKLNQAVEHALATDAPRDALEAITIEACGKSRILLNGLVQQLHHQNKSWLAEHHHERA